MRNFSVLASGWERVSSLKRKFGGLSIIRAVKKDAMRILRSLWKVQPSMNRPFKKNRNRTSELTSIIFIMHPYVIYGDKSKGFFVLVLFLRLHFFHLFKIRRNSSTSTSRTIIQIIQEERKKKQLLVMKKESSAVVLVCVLFALFVASAYSVSLGDRLLRDYTKYISLPITVLLYFVKQKHSFFISQSSSSTSSSSQRSYLR